MSEFDRVATPGELDTTKASAHLPGLDIEVVHRRSPAGDAEQISINLQAVPSLEAFGRYLKTANPFAFWAQATRLMWLPWFEAIRVMMRVMMPANSVALQQEQNAPAASRASDRSSASE